jgi:hypothetical protein
MTIESEFGGASVRRAEKPLQIGVRRADEYRDGIKALIHWGRMRTGQQWARPGDPMTVRQSRCN